MIHRNLTMALLETVQAHAERYHHGKMDLDRTLSAIGEIAAGLLASLTTAEDRVAHYSALVNGISQATTVNILNDRRSTTPQ